MKAVIKFLRWGGSAPHTPQAGAEPQTPRFCSGIESLMGNKPVYKIKEKKSNYFQDNLTKFRDFFLGGSHPLGANRGEFRKTEKGIR